MREYQIRTSSKPRPLPSGRWSVTQRWNDLLFAHWPVSAAQMTSLLPEELETDLFGGSAWLGIVPFWLDRVKMRSFPLLPGARPFPDLNVRTYVRDKATRTPGVFCFSLDVSSFLAVAVARLCYELPCHWAEMRMEQRSEREFAFYSRRRFMGQKVIFKARYRGLGPTAKTAELHPGSFESYITERNCLFSTNREGRAMRAPLHMIPWPLEEAEAEIERNGLAAAIGIELPAIEPVLHYSRRMAIYVWPAELMRPAMAGRPVTVAVSPSG